MKPQHTSSIAPQSRIQCNSPGSKKIWTITHSCGHRSERDLSDRAADRRAAFARWLTTRACTECWKDTRDADQDQATWLEDKRATERAEAQAWADQYRMPPLEGSDRAAAWAERCRHQLVTAAYSALVIESGIDEEHWQQIEEQVRTITRAGWWLDQRETEPGDLPELLAAATGKDRPVENPFL